ncbi:MAG: SurA N-terminal domain-containing protein, partial [Neisseriaceae bacterium]|nr:SurA N-terminal domain-containing protein [Neisseriaceae bacterium]
LYQVIVLKERLNNNMSLRKWLSAVLLGFGLLSANAAPVQWVDQIVVVVNQDVITQRDINDISNQIRAQVPKSELKKIDVKQVAIDNLIQQRLLKQAAENMQIKISEKEIDAEVEKIAASNKLTSEQFYKAIAREGVPKSMLRATVKDNLMVDALAKEVSQGQIEVTEAEIEALLNQNKMPATEQNKQDARNFIENAKQQEILSSIVQDLKNRAYIEYREKPY